MTVDTEPHLAALLEARKERRRAPPYIPQVDSEVQGLLDTFFAQELPGSTVSDVSRLGGGASKEQFVFSLTRPGENAKQYVLRMDPQEAITETSRSREWDILRAMRGTVPVPQVLAIDEDARIFPRPALIMEMMPGVPKPTGIDLSVTGLGTVLGDPLRGKIRPQYADLLAKIHNFDWRAADLASYAAPDADPGQATRWLINFWKELLEQDVVAKEPVLRLATQWLEANVPPCDDPCLVHGDFRTGNYLFDEDSGHITAVLDWEMSYIGDRHADFGWLLQPVFGTHIDGQFRASDIFDGTDDFIAAYEQAGGRPVDRARLHYFTIFNNWKSYILVSVLGIRAAKEAHNHQDVLLTFLACHRPPIYRRACAPARSGRYAMNPSVQDRLDSCVRALEHVILPALPDSASLAREQTMIVMGQVQIIRAQLDAAAGFEQEEADDLAAMAEAICVAASGKTAGLRTALDAADCDIPRNRTAALQDAIDAFLKTFDEQGGPPPAIATVICEYGARRAHKDRVWFSAMGFDAGFVPGGGA